MSTDTDERQSVMARARPATDPPRTGRLGPAAWVLAFLFLVVPIVLLVAHTLNRFEQQALLESDAAAIVRQVTAETSRLETALEALSAMHQADAGDERSGLLLLAAALRDRVPAISAIGRYERVAPSGWHRFVEEARNSGLYEFRIHDLDADGRAVDAPVRETAWPISLLEPMSPRELPLLGVDLAGVPGLSAALERTVDTATTHLARLPAHWTGTGELMLFQPVFRGTHTPTDTARRRRHADGGYWLRIDTTALLNAAADLHERFDVAWSTGSDEGPVSWTDTTPATVVPSTLEHLYGARQIEQRWHFGTTYLGLSLTGRIPVPVCVVVMVTIVLLLAASALAATLLAARQRHRRLVEHDRARLALFTEREKAECTLDAIGDAVFALAPDGRVQHANAAAERLLSADATDPLGCRLDELLPLRLADDPSMPFSIRSAMDDLANGAPLVVDLRIQDDAEPERTLRASLSRSTPECGGSIASDIILILRDNSEERRLTRQLEHQANHDALTGCTNRHFFEKRLDECLEKARTGDPRHALLYMDLDQFKVVNDTAGHAAGDRLLIELTADLTASLRTGDVLSRLGGDEFGLIIADVNRAEARTVADKVYRLFQSRVFLHDGRAFAVRASLGLVHFQETSGEIGDVLAAADIACYAAKENGRNELYEFRACDETMALRSSELNWLPRLQQALERDEFRLHAQPLADASVQNADGTLRIAHVEFLLRLSDEEGREITPWQIIQAAERYGLMRELDRWVIARALKQAARVQAEGHRDIGFSINLSGQSAADPTLIDFIEDQFRQHDIAPSLIWFELTETAAISHFATAVALAEGIQRLGARVALDDFGSGLSSFGYLKLLPVDVLKIDGQFVKDIASNSVDQEIVGAISRVARAMNIQTVAEFVEDAESVRLLGDIGIDFLQGFHIARPAPLDDVLRLAGGAGRGDSHGGGDAATALPRAA